MSGTKHEQKITTWMRTLGQGDHLVQLNQMLAEEAAQGWELIHYVQPSSFHNGMWTFAFRRRLVTAGG